MTLKKLFITLCMCDVHVCVCVGAHVLRSKDNFLGMNPYALLWVPGNEFRMANFCNKYFCSVS